MIFIYFVQAGTNGPIKIGCSITPKKRFANLQIYHYETLTLLGAIEKDDIVENRLHRALEGSRIRGEWFRPTPEVVRTIVDLLTATPTRPETLPVTPIRDLDRATPTPSAPSPLAAAVATIIGSKPILTFDTQTERKQIADALSVSDNNIGAAAKLLGWARRTLQNRMRATGLPRGRSGRRVQKARLTPPTVIVSESCTTSNEPQSSKRSEPRPI